MHKTCKDLQRNQLCTEFKPDLVTFPNNSFPELVILLVIHSLLRSELQTFKILSEKAGAPVPLLPTHLFPFFFFLKKGRQ